MPSINSTAQFIPLAPGKGRFTLNSFIASQYLGDFTNAIELLVVRRSDQILADWPNQMGDRFISIKPINPQQRSINFEFEVGQEVVNALAYDNSGDYILKIKVQDRSIRSFLVDMKGIPVAGGYSPKGMMNSDKIEPSIKANPEHGLNANLNQQANRVSDNPFAQTANFDSPNPNQVHAQEINRAASQAQAFNSGTGRKLSGLIGILCFIALLGIGGFFLKDFLLDLFSGLGGPQTTQEESKLEEQMAQEEANQEEETTAEDEIPNPPEDMEKPVVATHLSAACTLNGSSLSDTEILKQCLQSQPQVQELNDFLYESLATGHCEIAQRLLTSKGRSQSGSYFAYILSVYMDPQQTKSSNCFKKDAEQAKYWADRYQLDPKFDAEIAKSLIDRLPDDSQKERATEGSQQ